MRPVSVLRFIVDGKDELIVVKFRKHTNIIRGNKTLCSVELDEFMTAATFMGHEFSNPGEVLDPKDYTL